MINLFTDISKYMMILFICLYTVVTFFSFRVKADRSQNRIARTQMFFLYLMHFTGNAVAYFSVREAQIIVMAVIQAVYFAVYTSLYKGLYPAASKMLTNNACMLLCIGFLFQTRLDSDKALKQFIIVVAASLITLLVPVILEKYKNFQRWNWLYAIVGVVGLGVIMVAGTTEYGAKLSFTIAGISLQPSEFIKITFVFFTASMFARSTSFKQVAITTVIAALHVLLLVASRDLGSALVYFIAYLFMIFVGTGNVLYFTAGLGAGCGASVLAYFAFSHVRVRVSVWKDPFADILNDGWQMAQSLFAIGIGGWFGIGFYGDTGLPSNIPVAIKDFIFSVISEEMGAIFAICLFLICMECMIQFFWMSTRMKTLFNKMVLFGLAAIYGVQVFLNVAGVTNFIPSTGITLPFVSYGGSSILATFITFGIIQGLYIQRQKEVETSEKEEQRKLSGRWKRRTS